MPTNRHVGHGGKQLVGRAAVNLVEPDLAPDRIGYFGDKQPGGMEFLVVEKAAGVSRVLLDDQPFDRDARVDYQSHCRSVSMVAVFADQKLGGSLGAPLGCAVEFGRSGKEGGSLG